MNPTAWRTPSFPLILALAALTAAPAHAQDLKPSPGYAKRLDVYGIVIEGTEQVHNDWLYGAALVYEHMTRKETKYGIREQLAANGFRILLAGEDQPLDTLPEYAGDPGAAEAGGLGGNPGEYRIALRVGHPHVLIHELAHGIYHSAIEYMELGGASDPERVEAPRPEGSFTHRLHVLYDAAMEAGTWRGMYHEAHADEYWAEGVALWFRAQERNFLPEIAPILEEPELELLERDPRAFLAARDPGLHALVASLYPALDWWPLRMRIHGPGQLEFPEEDAGLAGFVRELLELVDEEPEEARSLLAELSRDIQREEGLREVVYLFEELGEQFEHEELRKWVEAHIARARESLEETYRALPAGPPAFELQPIPEDGRLAVFRPDFVKHVEVFGLQVVATPRTEDAKVLHAAHVLAQWLDNDEDGRVDDRNVHRVLVEGGAFLVMFETERERRGVRVNHRRLEEEGFYIGQDLYGDETHPDGPPHRQQRGAFDASLEEVLHLVSNGWCEAYPEAFGYRRGSRLTEAMDLARGGVFRRVPREYPEGAWYHYDDRTCEYECMAAEYLYWALTSLLGGQSYPGRAEEIGIEWECPTPELLELRDPAVHALLTESTYALPRVLPDGSYRR